MVLSCSMAAVLWVPAYWEECLKSLALTTVKMQNILIWNIRVTGYPYKRHLLSFLQWSNKEFQQLWETPLACHLSASSPMDRDLLLMRHYQLWQLWILNNSALLARNFSLSFIIFRMLSIILCFSRNFFLLQLVLVDTENFTCSYVAVLHNSSGVLRAGKRSWFFTKEPRWLISWLLLSVQQTAPFVAISMLTATIVTWWQDEITQTAVYFHTPCLIANFLV